MPRLKPGPISEATAKAEARATTEKQIPPLRCGMTNNGNGNGNGKSKFRVLHFVQDDGSGGRVTARAVFA